MSSNVDLAGRRSPLWQHLTLWGIGALVLLMYAGLWKPLWYDELLHFALGGMSFEYALKTIDYTTIEVNHGQTGVYMMLDWLLLQIFGANSIALRLPSLMAGALLLAAAVSFIRRRGLGFPWQVLVLAALAGHSFLMGFVGEARPYMPLAAAAISSLAYYQYDFASRRSVVPVIYGIAGVVGGALLHPYVVYLLAMILPFSVWMAVRDGRLTWSVRPVITFMNPWLLGTGAAAFLLIGQFTWMRRIASFGYGPFDLIGSSQDAVRLFISEHLIRGDTQGILAIGMLVVTLICLSVSRFRGARALVPPLALLLIGLMSSVALSVLSAMRTYWILERQWVAGIAVAAVALVWLFGELAHLARIHKERVLWVPVGLFVMLITWTALTASVMQVQLTTQWRDGSAAFGAETRTPEELWSAKSDDDGVIYLANVNASRGGPVWSQFIDWYNRQAGMRPEFREKNPSWTGFLGDSTNPE